MQESKKLGGQQCGGVRADKEPAAVLSEMLLESQSHFEFVPD